MTDNQLIELFLPIIKTGLIADGLLNVLVQQNFQPTQQGVPTAPTVFFQKVYTHRYGMPSQFPKWNGTVMQLHETQWYESRFQFSFLSIQNPLTTNKLTASDLAQAVARILQAQSTWLLLRASQVGVLKIENITNPYQKDDRDQFEAMPSFDFIMTHYHTRITTIPVVNSFLYKTYPI